MHELTCCFDVEHMHMGPRESQWKVTKNELKLQFANKKKKKASKEAS